MIKMKKILFAFAAMIVLAACGSEQAATTFESSEASNEVTFEVAKNYFFRNDQEIHRIQPVSIIILDNKYENKEVVLSEDK